MLQYAKETGIRVDDTTVERTILRVAEENKLSPDEFRKVLEREGIPYANYREDIRRQIIVQRVRDREVDSKVTVSDAEVDNYLATVASQAGGENEYLLSHIYITRARAGVARRRRSEPQARGAGAGGAQVGQGFRARSRRRTRARPTRRRAATSAGARARGCRRCSPTSCAR